MFDVPSLKAVKALINILLLEKDNIHGEDAARLIKALDTNDVKVLRELQDKYLE